VQLSDYQSSDARPSRRTCHLYRPPRSFGRFVVSVEPHVVSVCAAHRIPAEVGGKYSFRGHSRPVPNSELEQYLAKVRVASSSLVSRCQRLILETSARLIRTRGILRGRQSGGCAAAARLRAEPWVQSAMLDDVHDALLVMEQDTVLFLAEVQQLSTSPGASYDSFVSSPGLKR
jgi:hypothetical protein